MSAEKKFFALVNDNGWWSRSPSGESIFGSPLGNLYLHATFSAAVEARRALGADDARIVLVIVHD